MQQVLVGTRYQIVIPKQVRQKVKGLTPGGKVIVQPIDEETITIRPIKKNWAEENYGIMRKYWKGIDPIKKLEKMRDEWEK